MKLITRITKKIYKILPEILVILVCLVAQIIVISGKEGYHEDELLSFEMSNAYYTPWVTPTQPDGRMAKFLRNEIRGGSFGETLGNIKFIIADTFKNKGGSVLLSYKADVYDEPVWFDDDIFENYLTVKDEGAFSFTSAYWNIKDDNHPPVHALLLHLVSSIFRGKINPWIGCGLNLIFMVGILIFLEDLGRIIAKTLSLDANSGRILGLFAALMYGFSWGAMATVLLIRMYCILTFFVIASLDINLRIILKINVKKKDPAVNIALVVITALAFLTQYFFLFYCIPMAIATFIVLINAKRTKEALFYTRDMVLAAVIGIVLFPFSIGDVLSSGRGVEAIDNLSKGFSGYGERIVSFGKILGCRTFGSIWVLIALVIIYIAMVLLSAKDIRKTSFLSVTILPFTIYFFLAARMSPYMVDRYIMASFPAFVLFGATGVFAMLCRIFSREATENFDNVSDKSDAINERNVRIATPVILLCTCLLIARVIGLFSYDGEYQYKGYEKVIKTIETEMDIKPDLACICVYEGNCYENLLEFTYFDKTLMVTPGELSDREDRESVEALDEAVIIIKPSADYDYTIETLKGYGFTDITTFMTDETKGDEYLMAVR